MMKMCTFKTSTGKDIAVNPARVAFVLPTINTDKAAARIFFSGFDDDYIDVKDTYGEILNRLSE